MRRRRAAVLVFALAIAPPVAAAAADPVQLRAQQVRRAIPAIEFYGEENRGSYVGLTVGKLAKWDSRFRSTIVIRRATRTAYCVESRAKPIVHFAGPRGPLRRGRCGTRGPVVPHLPSPPPPPEHAARARLIAALPAIEAFASENDGYAGMTLAALRRYDAAIRDIRIVRAARTTYCIEAGSGDATYHKAGPLQPAQRGACPR